MTVNRYATQAGRRFESDLNKHMRELGWDVERLRLTGAEDEGDILLRVPDPVAPERRVVIEAKREKGFNLAGWVKEAQTERENYAAHRDYPVNRVGFVVVHYARGKGLGQSYVTTTLEEWLARL